MGDPSSAENRYSRAGNENSNYLEGNFRDRSHSGGKGYEKNEDQPASMPSNQRTQDPLLMKKLKYAKELQDQMRNKKSRKMEELMTDREQDFMMIKERFEHDPFGRAGNGAPKRDKFGNVITSKKARGYYGYDPRDLLNGNEDLPIKPHNQRVHDYDPLPEFSLKAKLARQNLLGQSNDFSYQKGPYQKTPQMHHKQPNDFSQNQNYRSMDDQGQGMGHSMSQPTLPQQQNAMPGTTAGVFQHYHIPVQNTPFYPNFYPYNFQMMPQPSQYPQHGGGGFPPDFSSIRHGSTGGGDHFVNHYNSPDNFNRHDTARRPEESSVRVDHEKLDLNNQAVDHLHPLPFPQAETLKDTLDKQKNIQKHLENQRELLEQIEAKKRRKAEEEARKREEEAIEEERIRREREELNKNDENEAYSRRNLQESMLQANKRLAREKFMQQQMNNTSSVSIDIPEKRKPKPKRVRTPVEEVEDRVRREHEDRERVTVEERIIKELPIEVERTIHNTIDGELEGMKREITNQQYNFHDQLLELKKQVVTANQERFGAQNEIDDLKYRLKQQQIQEEIRRTELYNALMKTYTQPPPILPTITKIDLDKDISSDGKFQFPKRPKGMKKGYYHEDDDRDILDHLLSNTKMIDSKPTNPNKMVETVDSRPGSTHEYDGGSGLQYLNYFNVKDEHQAVSIPQNTLMADLNDYEPVYQKKLNSDTGEPTSSITGIIKRNNQRLDALDELEYKEFKRYDKDTFISPPSDYNQNDRYGGRREDVQDDLIDKINNAKSYF